MKTKNKMIALVEIAIVLCSVFLVAIPAIAADQNQEMQKVSASEVTTASEDDYVLGIYSNANGDDTIDMGDVVYTKLAIFGKKPKTELCDAKYDGRINVLDVIQTKLIILGKEKELTILDNAERSVTVKMPVERFIPVFHRSPEVMLALGARDKIVAVDSLFPKAMPEFGLEELPVVSRHGRNIDYEKILALKTDLVVLPIFSSQEADVIAEKLPTVAVIVIDCMNRRTMVLDLKTMGIILGKEKEADALIDWIEKYDGLVGERTKDLKPEEMTRFLLVWSMSKGRISAVTLGHPRHNMGLVAEKCGGRNIAAELPGTNVNVDSEWVMKENPDVIFIAPMASGITGVGKTEADLDEFLTKTLADLPELENVNAVKNHKVYIFDFNLLLGPRWIIANCYIAKCLHPELFKDIHPEEMYKKEYLSEFHDLELEGTWAYPLPE